MSVQCRRSACFRNPSVKVRFLQIPQPLVPLVSTFLTSTLGALALFAAWLCVNVHRKHQSLTWFHCERSTRGSYGPGLCRIKVSVLLMLFFGSFTVLSWLTSGGGQCFCPDTLPVITWNFETQRIRTWIRTVPFVWSEQIQFTDVLRNRMRLHRMQMTIRRHAQRKRRSASRSASFEVTWPWCHRAAKHVQYFLHPGCLTFCSGVGDRRTWKYLLKFRIWPSSVVGQQFWNIPIWGKLNKIVCILHPPKKNHIYSYVSFVSIGMNPWFSYMYTCDMYLEKPMESGYLSF